MREDLIQILDKLRSDINDETIEGPAPDKNDEIWVSGWNDGLSKAYEYITSVLEELEKNNMREDLIPGGIGDNLNSSYFDKTQLKIGAMVELEHTNDKMKAIEIAKDHLKEDPQYYTKLYQAGLVDEPKAIAYIKKQGVEESAKMKFDRILSEEISNYLIELEFNKQVKYDMAKSVYRDEIKNLDEEKRQRLQQYFVQKRIKVEQFVQDYIFYYDSSDKEIEAILDSSFKEPSKRI